MPKLIMLSGPSGSGKSTIAQEMLEADGNAVRLNRDLIRSMSIIKWTPKREGWIIDAEKAMARAAALSKRNVIIDDTNLTQRDEDMWKRVAQDMGYTFEKKAIEADILTCVHRDGFRYGSQKIGRAAIERQFLRGKLIKWPTDKQVVIFDIDGTLADLQHRVPWITVGGPCPNCVEPLPYHFCDRRDFAIGYEQREEDGAFFCPYCDGTKKLKKKQHDIFYSLVRFDKPIEAVIKWAQACATSYYVIIVSGRSPEKSGDDTVDWLTGEIVPFEHIFMRRANNHGPDTDEKQLILDDIIASGLSKEQIAFVVDDRPSVIEMWRKNGIRVYPVRGRDDDNFYEIMNNLEATHPRPELEANEG